MNARNLAVCVEDDPRPSTRVEVRKEGEGYRVLRFEVTFDQSVEIETNDAVAV